MSTKFEFGDFFVRCYASVVYAVLVCPSVWCRCSIPVAEWLDLSAVCIAQLAQAVGKSILYCDGWHHNSSQMTLGGLVSVVRVTWLLVRLGIHFPIHYCYYICLMVFSRTTRVSWHQKGKPFWILMKQEIMGGIGISWTICKSFSPCSRPVTMPVPRHSAFYRPDAVPPNQNCQSNGGIFLLNNFVLVAVHYFFFMQLMIKKCNRKSWRKSVWILNVCNLQEFLNKLNMGSNLEDDQIHQWHPKFVLNEVPDIEAAPLPQPPVVKKFMTAKDVLDEVKDKHMDSKVKFNCLTF